MNIEYKVEVKTYTIKVADGKTFISNPDMAKEILCKNFNPIQEEMNLLIINNKNGVIDNILLARGGHNSLTVTPAEILRQILLTDGNRFILAHNHPSGDCEPSDEDKSFTKRIDKAARMIGIDLLDHIVYSSDDVYSFRQNQLI